MAVNWKKERSGILKICTGCTADLGNSVYRLSFSPFTSYIRDVKARHCILMLVFIGHLKIFLGHCPPVFRSFVIAEREVRF